MAEKAQPLPEAPFSLTFRGYTQDGYNPQLTVRAGSIEELALRYEQLMEFADKIGLGSEHPAIAEQKSADEITVEFDKYAVGKQNGRPLVYLFSLQPGKSQFATTIWPERVADLPFQLTGKEQIVPTKGITREDALNAGLANDLIPPIKLTFPFEKDANGDVVMKPNKDGTRSYPVEDTRNWYVAGTVSRAGNTVVEGAWAKAVGALPENGTAAKMVSWCRDQETKNGPVLSAEELDEFTGKLSEYIGEGGSGDAVLSILVGRDLPDLLDNPPKHSSVAVIKRLLAGEIENEAEKTRIGNALNELWLAYQKHPEL